MGKGNLPKGGFMFFHVFTGRVLGFFACVVLPFYCPLLGAAGASTSLKHAEAKNAEVAMKYKAEGLAEFRLANYQEELLECSALSAIHMWVGDNIGEDSGSEIRKTISEDYWLDISKDFLALAKEASGKEDLSQEVRVQIKGLAAEWRRLSEAEVSADEWVGWYDLIDRCDEWRPEKTARSYYSKGRETIADQNPGAKVALGSK